MKDFSSELQLRLDTLREQGLHRELRRIDSAQSTRIEIGGRSLLNFSSNDYLGLASHPALREAAIKATEKFGAGSGASRLICGSIAPHHELEEALCQFKGTEGALSFSSGYAAAIGTICALMSKEDVIVLDKLVHASIVDAARLSGAKLRIFAHNNLNELDDILKWTVHRKRENAAARTLIVTESIFSMDGDAAPLAEIVSLKNKYGAWLMVDEAHATGLFGMHGRGLGDEMGVSNQIEVQMGTLGKALGAAGGYICGSRPLIDFLVNRARSFIFSTAPVPASSAAAAAGVSLAGSTEGDTLRSKLRQSIQNLKNDLSQMSRNTTSASAIIPIIIGNENDAIRAATELRDEGIFIPAIRYPTVARGTARLRITLTANHNEQDLSILSASLGRILS